MDTARAGGETRRRERGANRLDREVGERIMLQRARTAGVATDGRGQRQRQGQSRDGRGAEEASERRRDYRVADHHRALAADREYPGDDRGGARGFRREGQYPGRYLAAEEVGAGG